MWQPIARSGRVNPPGRGIDSGRTVRHPPAVTTAGAIDELDDHQHAAVHAAGDATGHDASGDADAGDGRMFCYRHPDRETWLRCGRCDQPICTKCSVMGPVGARCRVCGLRPNDGLSKFTPRQLVLGTGVLANLKKRFETGPYDWTEWMKQLRQMQEKAGQK